MLGTVCVSLVLAACGSGVDGAERSAAAPDEGDAVPARLGVRVCVANDSERDIRLNWLRPERGGQDRIRPGESRCDGGRYDWASEDVAIKILWDDNLTSYFSFNNPTIGWPTVTQDPGQSSAASACGIGDIPVGDWRGLGFTSDCFTDYDVGTSQTYVDATTYHGLVITRGADSEVDKTFAVSVKQ